MIAAFLIANLLMVAHADPTAPVPSQFKNFDFKVGIGSATVKFEGPPVYDPSLEKETPKQRDERILEEIMRASGVKMSMGGDVSGGGSAIHFKGKKPYLVDFTTFEVDFKEERGFADKKDVLFNVPLTPENIITGVPLNLKERMPIPYAIVEERLKDWESNSPITVAAIRQVLEKTSWRTTVLQFKGIEDIFVPSKVDRKKIPVSPVSMVFRSSGVFIMNGFWSILRGNTSRAGLLIHEALRSIQVEQSTRLNTKTIQIITEYITLRKAAPGGSLDSFLIGDLWSEDGWASGDPAKFVKSPAENCQFYDLIYNKSKDFIDHKMPRYEQYNDEAFLLARLKELDMELRPVFGMDEIPALADVKSLKDIPVRTMTFYLDHFLDTVKAVEQKTLPLDLVKSSPVQIMSNMGWFAQKPIWNTVLNNFENLRSKVCVSKASPMPQNAKDYMLTARTLLRMISSYNSIFEPQPFFQNFSAGYAGLSKEQHDFVQEVYNEAGDAYVCWDPRLKMQTTVMGNYKLAPVENCKPMAAKHFKNGNRPSIPRIGSK